jgi:hypothetical protein
MNLADVFTVTFIILGFFIAFVAYWLATAGLFPQLTERCAERFAATPGKCTAMGLVVWLPVLFIGTKISSSAPNGALKTVGVLIMITSMLVALAGSSGLALRVGSGLKATRDEQEPWRRVLRGGITLGFTFMPPFVGTFVMAWTLTAGFGAFLLARPKRAKVVLPEVAPAPVATAEPVAQ